MSSGCCGGNGPLGGYGPGLLPNGRLGGGGTPTLLSVAAADAERRVLDAERAHVGEVGVPRAGDVAHPQPPQALKTGVKFAISARFLIGEKLNLQTACPEMIISIINWED